MGVELRPAGSAVTATPEQEAIAARFVGARMAGAALPGFPGAIPATLEEAYLVQDAGIARMAAPIGGWKVGRILPPQSGQYGADRLAGPIFSKSILSAQPGQAPAGHIYVGGFGAAEAELLLRLKRTPPPRRHFSLDEAAELIDRVHVGLEIASSPLKTINELGPPVIISDFGNNNGLIVGPEITDWRSQDIANLPVSMSIDGRAVGTGSAAAFTDGPIGSVRFLLELMAARGIALAPGTWISSGAITGVHDVSVGQHVEARFGDHLVTRCAIAAVPAVPA